MIDGLKSKTTLNDRQFCMEDNFWWRMTFDGMDKKIKNNDVLFVTK